jgi:hypothetical protein
MAEHTSIPGTERPERQGRGASWRTRARRMRRLIAGAVALVPLVCLATPAHADLEAVYALPWAICDTHGSCTARTAVHVLLPSDYATCVAALTAADQLGGSDTNVGPLSLEVDECGAPDRQDAFVEAWAQWISGSCVGSPSAQSTVSGNFPLWSTGSGGANSAAPSCATMDSSYTQTFTMPGCPGTSFQVTVDVRGNADGSYKSAYAVNGSGPCASAFDVVAVEGPAPQRLITLPGL